MPRKNNKYNIITIGCQMNKSDSERIAGLLEKKGWQSTDNIRQASLAVVNTCGVRQSAEDRVYGLVPKIKKENPKVKILITGCLSERKDVKKRLGDWVDVWMPTNKISDFRFKILDLTIEKNNKLRNLSYLKIKPKYNSKISAFVPIGNGCNNFCAYCVVPYARGREVYRPADEIINEVKALVKKGYKEIFLIAQNVNSYKYNTNDANRTRMTRIANNANFDVPGENPKKYISFPRLLKLVNDIPGNFWIRFATSHPKDMSDELIKTIAKCKKVCEHIHLPVQAGDDKVLKAMNRGYSVKHYKELIGKIKKCNKSQIQSASWRTKFQIQNPKIFIPNISITTDVIVGFPGETKEQFNNTRKLFSEIKFDMAYIAKYSPRPGTAAAKLRDNVSREEKKRREEELMKILRKTALANNKKYLGKIVEILVEGKNKKGEWYGKARTDKVVKIHGARNTEHGARNTEQRANLIGEFIMVKVSSVEDFGLKGEIIK
ncbi:MAG: tRNA (N6-isopentenyl adenosine(37)-C2)-methylthiotransferase MiaB [Patescibacteria group bacterium]